MSRQQQAQELQKQWDTDSRWKGVRRNYTAEDVVRLRGSLQIEHTLAKRGAEKLWELVNNEPFVNALGALTGNQAMQQVKAGLKAIYLVRLASCRRCQRGWRNVSRSIAVSGQFGADGGQAHQ
jgi:isocitrate lyase